MTLSRIEMQTHDALQQLPRLIQNLTAALTPAVKIELQHVPSVAPLRDGSWGVICPACSDAAHEYVSVCTNPGVAEWPPAQLYASPAREEAIQAALTACRHAVASYDRDTPAYDLGRRVLALLTGPQ